MDLTFRHWYYLLTGMIKAPSIVLGSLHDRCNLTSAPALYAAYNEFEEEL